MLLDQPSIDPVEDLPTSSTTGSTAAPVADRISPRRRWSTEDKRALVEASYDPTSSVAEVAACFGVSPAQLYSWRRQIADGTLDQPPSVAPSFARVEVDAHDVAVPAPVAPAATGSIEITFPDGAHLMVDGPVDELVIERIILALRQ